MLFKKSEISIDLKCSDTIFINRLISVIEPWEKDNSNKLFIGKLDNCNFCLKLSKKREGFRELDLQIEGLIKSDKVVLQIGFSKVMQRLFGFLCLILAPAVCFVLIYFPFALVVFWLIALAFGYMFLYVGYYSKLEEIRRVFRGLSLK